MSQKPVSQTTKQHENQNSLFRHGDFLFWKCEYQKAKEVFEEILLDPSITALDLARCYSSLGAANAKLNNYDEAINNYNQQLELLKRLPTTNKTKSNTAKCYMSIGMIYSLKNQYSEAINRHEEALLILSEIPQATDLLSNIYQNMANLYTRANNFDKALFYFEKALKFDGQHFSENHAKFGQTYANIGALYYAKQDYLKALHCFKRARDSWQKSLSPNHMCIESMENTIRNVESKLRMYFLNELKV